MWIWVSLSYASFGIRVDSQRVVDAAPIGRWMIGKDTKFIRDWILKKGGTWECIVPEDKDENVKLA
jgi:hypothetical protein